MNLQGKLPLKKPNKRQLIFLKEHRKFIAFGGARGGGKSWAVRTKALLMCAKYPGIKVMIIRRSYPELMENHIRVMRKEIPLSLAKYNDSRKEFIFANGSVILFRYCSCAADLDNYQGTETDVLFIDEATQFSEEVFKVFTACVRGVNGFPKRVYLTCNPGGVGHGWVKRLFIDRRFKKGEDPEDYAFIKSLVTDNLALLKSQPEYIRQLEALPEKLKKAWLHGDWDIFEGQFFEEFADVPERYEDRTFTHVIEPFDPPHDWVRYRSFDFGYAKPFSCGWWAISPDGILYRILELYGCTATPNEGVKWTPEHIFEEIARIEREHPYLKDCEIHGVADPSIWDASRGISVADTAAKCGVYFSPGDNKRIPGWMQVHYRLGFDSNGVPLMQVFKNCKGFIRTIPLLTFSDTDPEDCDTSGEDHIADEVRYMCMTRPITPRNLRPPDRLMYDPLDIGEKNKKLTIYDI